MCKGPNYGSARYANGLSGQSTRVYSASARSFDAKAKQQRGAHEAGRGTSGRVFFWMFVWYAVSLFNLIANKKLLSEYKVNVNVLGMSQLLTSALLGLAHAHGGELWKVVRSPSQIVKTLDAYFGAPLPQGKGSTRDLEMAALIGSDPASKKLLRPRINWSTINRELWRDMIILGMLRGTTLVLSLVAISYVAVSFVETIKATAPVTTVVFSWFILRERTPVPVVLALFPVMAGLIVCTASEMSFNMIGFLCAVTVNCLDCFQNVLSKKIMAGGHYTPVQLQFYVSVAAAMYQIPFMAWKLYRLAGGAAAMGSGEGGDWSGMVLPVFLCSVTFYVQSISAYYTVSLISSVSQSVANTTKRTLLIFLSILYFGNPVSGATVLGIIMVSGGVLLYNIMRTKYQK